LIAAKNLIPLNLPNLKENHIDEIKNFYGKFMTNTYENLDCQLKKCTKEFEDIPNDQMSSSANSDLAVCYIQTFPSIHKILTLFLTVPVDSVSCERSFSALHRLKLSTRSSITE
jgi:hAT family C-terminal dimerisation region